MEAWDKIDLNSTLSSLIFTKPLDTPAMGLAWLVFILSPTSAAVSPGYCSHNYLSCLGLIQLFQIYSLSSPGSQTLFYGFFSFAHFSLIDTLLYWLSRWCVGLILSREDPLEKSITTHSSILAWEIPWTKELGGLWSMGSQRVGNNWSDLAAVAAAAAANFFIHSCISRENCFFFFPSAHLFSLGGRRLCLSLTMLG